MAEEKRKRRILVVEDEVKIRQLVAEYLELAGFEVITAADGEEAIAAVREHAPMIVILDLGLPKRSGLDVCLRLRHDPTFARLPIILFTGKEQDDVVTSFGTDRQLLQEWQANAYVHKSDGISGLIREIHRLIGSPTSIQGKPNA